MTNSPEGKSRGDWERHEARRAARDAAREARDAARQARDEARKARDAARDQGRERPPAPGTQVASTLDLAGITRVHINHTAGKLTLRQAAGAEAAAVNASSSKQAPELHVERHGETLEIHVKLSMGRLFRRRQGAQAEIVLPPGLEEVRIEMGAGKVEVASFEAMAMHLHAGAGDMVIHDTTAELAVEVGAGRVAVEGHSGIIRCETGTGDVSAGVVAAPPGRYEISTGMGGAELRLPAGLQVTARVSSGIGQTKIDYPLAGTDAPVHVVVNTGIGKAVLREGPSGRTAGATGERVRPQRPGSRPPGAGSSDAAELRVIQLLEQGRISAREAADLIAALKGQPPAGESDD